MNTKEAVAQSYVEQTIKIVWRELLEKERQASQEFHNAEIRSVQSAMEMFAPEVTARLLLRLMRDLEGGT